jgi:putative inorganic carbon (hco3(-)) transporter
MSKRRRRHQIDTPPKTAAAVPNSLTQVDTWLVRLIHFLFYLMLIVVPFTFTWINDELFEFNKMLLTYGFVVLIGGLWLSRMVVSQKIIFARTKFDIPLGLFLASQVISTITSIHPYTSVFGYYSRFHGGLLSTLTYLVLFYAFVSNFHKKQLKAVLLAIFIGAFGASLYAIPEHFGVSPSCVMIAGTANVDCWVQDVQSRVFGTFGQPNWLAAYAITLIPVAVSLLLASFTKNKSLKNKSAIGRKILFFASLVALTLTLLYTKSRSGILGLVVGGGIYGLGFLIITWRSVKPNQTFKPALFLASVMISLGLWVGTPFTPSLSAIVNQFRTPIASDLVIAQPATSSPSDNGPASPPPPIANRLDIGGTDSGEIRKIVWQGAYDVWKRYPIFGSGVETFAYSYYQDRPEAHNLVSEWDFLYNKAHNEFLNFLATTGVVGLSSYLLLLFWIVAVCFHKIYKSSAAESDQLLALGVASGVIALSVSNFFGFSTVMVNILLFILPAVISVLYATKDQQSVPAAANNSSPKQNLFSLPQLAGLFIILLSSVYLTIHVSAIWRADRAYTLGKQLARSGRLSEGATFLKSAVDLRPQEALFHDELALAYANMAIAFADRDEPENSATFIQVALAGVQNSKNLNSVHLNFFKSRARTYITLHTLDKKYLEDARRTLLEAKELAPTDAKVLYNIGLIELSQNKIDLGHTTLEETLALKPNYPAARMTLADSYSEHGQYKQAYQHYQYILDKIDPANSIAADKISRLEATQSAALNN